MENSDIFSVIGSPIIKHDEVMLLAVWTAHAISSVLTPHMSSCRVRIRYALRVSSMRRLEIQRKAKFTTDSTVRKLQNAKLDQTKRSTNINLARNIHITSQPCSLTASPPVLPRPPPPMEAGRTHFASALLRAPSGPRSAQNRERFRDRATAIPARC
jgi:hypothetical protein